MLNLAELIKNQGNLTTNQANSMPDTGNHSVIVAVVIYRHL